MSVDEVSVDELSWNRIPGLLQEWIMPQKSMFNITVLLWTLTNSHGKFIAVRADHPFHLQKMQPVTAAG